MRKGYISHKRYTRNWVGVRFHKQERTGFLAPYFKHDHQRQFRCIFADRDISLCSCDICGSNFAVWYHLIAPSFFHMSGSAAFRVPLLSRCRVIMGVTNTKGYRHNSIYRLLERQKKQQKQKSQIILFLPPRFFFRVVTPCWGFSTVSCTEEGHY